MPGEVNLSPQPAPLGACRRSFLAVRGGHDVVGISSVRAVDRVVERKARDVDLPLGILARGGAQRLPEAASPQELEEAQGLRVIDVASVLRAPPVLEVVQEAHEILFEERALLRQMGEVVHIGEG
eukprot:CAMPEP_0206045528 /NCGR_PEP_ID=MMETSP1466-20131121/16156_1 /ASSEMBLY_ACC=CAM_ASM_001126 /TAXON_ID=44452 /ORGANISM="Pavlova gyrans, Strain CCMP608" /LENGTH=124 /DNA_ID=CAMNT_0053420467 /DNA_START=123 /DNA_END=495 /DNA_ORIENTATION=+